jgi:long-subunit fatty acid transport protein
MHNLIANRLMNRFAFFVLLNLSLFNFNTLNANPFFIAKFNGLLGGPLDSSAFSVFWNPARLDQKKFKIDLYTAMISRQASYDRFPTDANADPQILNANSGLATTSSVGFVPSLAIAKGFELNKDWRIGFGLGAYIARAGASNWDRRSDAPAEFPGASDGPQRWNAISTNMVFLTYSAGMSIGYQRLSLGFALNYNDVSLSTVRAANPDKSEIIYDISGKLSEGRIYLKDAAGSAFTWTAGLYLKIDEKGNFRTGLSYRRGNVYGLKGKGFVTFGVAQESTMTAAFPLQVADSIHWSFAWRINQKIQLRPEIEYMNWSIMDRQVATNLDVIQADGSRPTLLELERQFKDTFAYRLRSDFKITDAFTMHGGFSYETGATPQKTHEPGLAENNQIELGVGASYRLNENLMIHSSFFYQHFFKQTVRNSIQKPQANGVYLDDRQYLTLNLQYRF